MTGYPNYNNYNNANTVICTIENDAIVQMGAFGNPPKQIGVTKKAYDELYSLLEQYRNKLIELGVIEKEKTAEEINKENQLMLSAILQRLENLEKEKNQNVELKEFRPKESDTSRAELFPREKGTTAKRS